jgi:hypothetical protein
MAHNQLVPVTKRCEFDLPLPFAAPVPGRAAGAIGVRTTYLLFCPATAASTFPYDARLR